MNDERTPMGLRMPKMTQLPSIHAAILGQNGNHDPDQHYPRPLECSQCGVRPKTQWGYDFDYEEGEDIYIVWYVTTDDPLPTGWQEIPIPGFTRTLPYCPECAEQVAGDRLTPGAMQKDTTS